MTRTGPDEEETGVSKRGDLLFNLCADLPSEVEVRVWDTTAETRYIVHALRPDGSHRFSENQLAELVTRKAMIGVALVPSPA
jgi:nitrile hydratase